MIMLFMEYTISFILELGELVAKHFKYFSMLTEIEKPDIVENQDVCKWKIHESESWRYISDCGCVAPRIYFTRNHKGKLSSPAVCPKCGKKIEVVE
jgi:hypothetical protein